MRKAQKTARALIAATLLTTGVVAANDTPPTSYYTDVPQHHWAAPAVNALSAEGVLLGNPDGSFGGTTLLSRYELAMILHRYYINQQQQVFGPQHEFAETIAALEEQVATLTQANADLTNIMQQLMATQNIEVSALNSRIKELEQITEVLQTLSTTVAVGPQGPPGPAGPPGPIAYVHVNANGEILSVTPEPQPTQLQPTNPTQAEENPETQEPKPKLPQPAVDPHPAETPVAQADETASANSLADKSTEELLNIINSRADRDQLLEQIKPSTTNHYALY